MAESRPTLLVVLVILSVEKFVQHTVVTAALLVDFRGIRSTVAVDYRLLVVSGFLVGILFAADTPFLLRRRAFSFKLLFGLASFDVLGEFAAQGTLGIDVTLSFVVACTILIILIARGRRLAGTELGGT
mgnify:CR=1 FL=1